MKVHLGCFGLVLGDEKFIKDAGYDAAEFNVARIMELDNSLFGELKKRFLDTGLDFSVFDNPIPLTERISDPGFKLENWQEYLLRASERCSQLGCKKYVFGNGKTRSLPIEGDISAARNKLDDFINMLCDISLQFEIMVMLEPLGKSYSNIFNTIEDCANAIKYYGKKNLSSLIDLRHIVALDLPMSEISKYKDNISHIHIDNPYSIVPDRYYPSVNDEYDYKPFFDVLDEIGYNGIISVEANKYENYAQDIKNGLSFFEKNNIGH